MPIRAKRYYDTSPNKLPVTNEKDDDYLLTVSMFGTKITKQNVMRTGILSVNLVSTDMLELMDYFGTHHAKDGKKDEVSYNFTVVITFPPSNE